ncbi:MAG: copper amine oxidase N-terminal domain-containing protein, partial [Sporomusaceae bacterium]|nr:copper amine oxidase N-terminal domain-containing protein [Sporomusaceae bacterium]
MIKKHSFILQICLLFIVFAFYSSPVFAAQDSTQPIKVSIDGKYIDFKVYPTIVDGTTLVQLKPIFQALGAQVSWDDDTKTVTGVKNSSKIMLQIDNSVATVNGNNINLQVAARIIEGNTMVPARFIAESLGADVGWDSDTNTVLISPLRVITFADENLEKVVRAAIRKDSGDILSSDVKDI